jgi:hypothetical protein
MKETRTERFELRLTPTEAQALRNISEKQDATMSVVVSALIERSAKRQKCWPNGK